MAKKPPQTTSKSRYLEIQRQSGKSEDRMLTDLIADGEATNASLALQFVYAEHGEGSLTDMVASLRAHGEAVNRGDLSAAERMLNAQAVALNTLFSEMARRAALNMGAHLSATEAYMRLALKAQAQCRATLETLAAVKNPPVLFARQANINHGGQQQVNNGATGAPDPARAAIAPAAPTGLLEASDGQWVDAGTAGAAGGADPHLEAVGAIHRPTQR